MCSRGPPQLKVIPSWISENHLRTRLIEQCLYQNFSRFKKPCLKFMKFDFIKFLFLLQNSLCKTPICFLKRVVGNSEERIHTLMPAWLYSRSVLVPCDPKQEFNTPFILLQEFQDQSIFLCSFLLNLRYTTSETKNFVKHQRLSY